MEYMPKISTEQYKIIETLNENCNINILAYAGSGKTTCILYIAKYFPNKKIFVITYNSKLKLETRQRVERLGLHNVEVHSYHSFGVKYYDNYCFKDNNIMQICNERKQPIRDFNFDLIIFDECQDMTPLYYEFAQKMYFDNKNPRSAHIITMGDLKQCIFGFNGADERYIEYANILMNINKYPWKTCKLEISYRLTTTTANFVNMCMFNGGENIKSIKKTTFKPKYIVCDLFKDSAYKEVEYYLNIGYKPDDIFILAPSIKAQNSPARRLENKIKQRLKHVNVFVPTTDEETLSEDVLQNKIVFSTIHQTKGLEREVVILFGFDASYFEFFGKKLNPNICPNELYVAATRAKSHLVLLHNNSKDFLPFLNQLSLSQYADYQEKHKLKHTTRICKDDGEKEVSPTELIRFLNDVVICECLTHLNITRYDDNIIKKIKIPLTVKNTTKNTTENVADINGIAIPLYFELKKTNNISIVQNILHMMNKNVKYKIFDEAVLKIPPANMKIEHILYIANCLQTIETEYLFKICQIDCYNWLDDVSIIDKCMKRLEGLNISSGAIYEKYISINCKVANIPQRETIIKGYIDCIDENKIYEFKCVSKLENKHILQLAIYMYMIKTKQNNIYENRNANINANINANRNAIGEDNLNHINSIDDGNEYILYNILNNEKIKLEASYDKLQKIINIIFINKYGNKRKHNDDEFINMNMIIKNKYSQNNNCNIINSINDVEEINNDDNYNKFDELNKIDDIIKVDDIMKVNDIIEVDDINSDIIEVDDINDIIEIDDFNEINEVNKTGKVNNINNVNATTDNINKEQKLDKHTEIINKYINVYKTTKIKNKIIYNVNI